MLILVTKAKKIYLVDLRLLEFVLLEDELGCSMFLLQVGILALFMLLF